MEIKSVEAGEFIVNMMGFTAGVIIIALLILFIIRILNRKSLEDVERESAAEFEKDWKTFMTTDEKKK